MYHPMPVMRWQNPIRKRTTNGQFLLSLAIAALSLCLSFHPSIKLDSIETRSVSRHQLLANSIHRLLHVWQQLLDLAILAAGAQHNGLWQYPLARLAEQSRACCLQVCLIAL